MPLANVKSKDFFLENTSAFLFVSDVFYNATNAFDPSKTGGRVMCFVAWNGLPNFVHEKAERELRDSSIGSWAKPTQKYAGSEVDGASKKAIARE